MTSRRMIVLATMMLLATVLPALPALGAPPDNDNFEDSVVIDPAALPFEATVDTTEATNEGADLEAGALCEGPPATDAGVWYSITTTEDTDLLVDTGGSDYTSGIIVLTGEPGSFELVDCAPQDIQVFAAAGVTHHLMIMDDQLDEIGNGGTLELVVLAIGPDLCPGINLADPDLADVNVIIGTDGDDVLQGTRGPDLIVGLDGNDHISGLGGDDFLAGCDGDDVLLGGSGNDSMTGDDLGFFGNPDAIGGNDTMDGGRGDDEMLGGPGNDTMLGGPGNDAVIGHQGDDKIQGDGGDDFVAAGFGNDNASGGSGDDFVTGGWGDDNLSGGPGSDFINGAPPAFEEFDPEPDAVDTCVGDDEDFIINCEA